MNKKSPFPGYSLKQVSKMENKYFCLHFGGDFILENGEYLFTKSEAFKIYNKTLQDLLGIIEDGCEKDKKYALDLIAGLSVKSVRLH